LHFSEPGLFAGAAVSRPFHRRLYAASRIRLREQTAQTFLMTAKGVELFFEGTAHACAEGGLAHFYIFCNHNIGIFIRAIPQFV
jgi:hypothetical protein